MVIFLLLTIAACTSHSVSSKASFDTKTCNVISYGNTTQGIDTLDSIYKKCMKDKEKVRERQKKEKATNSFIDFLFESLWSSKH